MLSITCRCGASLSGNAEDELLAALQAHVDGHADERGVPRHILTIAQLHERLRLQDRARDASCR